MKALLLTAVFALAAGPYPQQNPAPAPEELYASAVVDSAGQLRIQTVDGREIVPARESASFDNNGTFQVPAAGPDAASPDNQQVGFDSPAISPDKRTVGWLALYPNCCTSYPIPLYVVLYSNGKVVRLKGEPRPVFQWRFLDGGKKIAFEQETVHGGWGVHYELHEVSSGKLLAAYDPHVDSNEQVDDDPNARPEWVKAVDAAK